MVVSVPPVACCWLHSPNFPTQAALVHPFAPQSFLSTYSVPSTKQSAG